jgi:hypothetical protein
MGLCVLLYLLMIFFAAAAAVAVVVLPSGTLSVQCHPTIPRALQLGELPLILLCHQDLDELLDESWVTQLVQLQQPSDHQQLQQGSRAVAAGAAGMAVAGSTFEGRDAIISMSTPFASSSLPSSSPSAAAAVAEAAAAAVVPAAAAGSSHDEAAAATLAVVTDDDVSDDGRPDCYSSRRSFNGDQDHVTIDMGGRSSSTPKVTAAHTTSVAVAAAGDMGGSSSSRVVRDCCPQVILLSQGDVTDSLASLVKHLPSLTVVNVSNTQLGPRVSQW